MTYDIIGNIAILKGEDKTRKQKLKEARALLRKPHIRTVLEKSTNVKGRLRTIKTKYILGEKTLIAECRENNSIFRLLKKAYKKYLTDKSELHMFRLVIEKK